MISELTDAEREAGYLIPAGQWTEDPNQLRCRICRKPHGQFQGDPLNPEIAVHSMCVQPVIYEHIDAARVASTSDVMGVTHRPHSEHIDAARVASTSDVMGVTHLPPPAP